MLINMPLWVHRFFLAAVFTVMTWLFVDRVIIDIGFLQYFFVEVTYLISLKLYIFILQLQFPDDDSRNGIE